MKTHPVRIGLLGCGTVGSGVIKLLSANARMLATKLGGPLELSAVVDRDPAAAIALGVDPRRVGTDPRTMVVRPDIDVVVELFGGREPARSLLLAAIAAGKDVVTANKALLAQDGARIFKTAERHGRMVGFEASVGGGIPIIRTLRQALAGDRQRAVYGIVNGTCNYILSTMSDSGAEFNAVLAQAQQQGLAEADPTLDIGGYDAAHKLCLLVRLAFGVALTPAQVHTEGIAAITPQDIAYARELGYAIKLLAIAKESAGAIEARVHPTMIRLRHLLADVAGAYNAIYIEGEALGSTMYFGLGAGQMPTATAVLADIIEVARLRRGGLVGADNPLGYPVDKVGRAVIKPMDDVLSEYYLRFMAADKPGVLGTIASVLGRNRISIASVIQQERASQAAVPVVMRTHDARERYLKRALAEIRRRRIVRAAPVFIRIEERL